MMPGLKNGLMLFCIFIVVWSATAQDLPPLSKKDSSNLLITLATEKIRAASPREAEQFLNQAHALATSIDHEQGKGRALYLLARIQREANRMDEAIESFLAAAKSFEHVNDSSEAGRCYTNLGSIYIYHLNNYTLAYRYCTRAVGLLVNDTIYRPSALSNLASLYVQTKKYDEALAIYRQSYDDERKNNNLRGMCLALNNMATAYDYKKEFAQSYVHYEKALVIAQQMNDHKMIAHILIGMSPVQCNIGNHTLSAQLAEKALSTARKHGFASSQISALCLLGYEAAHDHDFQKAKIFLLEAEQISTRQNLPVHKREIYGLLSDILEKSGDEKGALRYRTKQTHHIDSMANVERLALSELVDQQINTQNSTQTLATSNAAFPMRSGAVAVGVVILLAGVGFVFYKTSTGRRLSDSHSLLRNDNVGSSAESDKTNISTEEKAVAAMDRHLEVLHGHGVKLVSLRDILWFQKDGKLYQAVAKEGQYRVRQNITELEELLHHTSFFRINRSVIINMSQMNNYSFWENHKYIVRMKDQARTEFIISRNRLREMKETFQVVEA